jgi:hypothetical protein
MRKINDQENGGVFILLKRVGIPGKAGAANVWIGVYRSEKMLPSVRKLVKNDSVSMLHVATNMIGLNLIGNNKRYR